MTKHETITKLVEIKNREKRIFTAGPASLLSENLSGLEPCFGRGDQNYDLIEGRVLKNLKSLSGHSNIARLQGSGSAALEVMISNFAFGKVLIIDTGYYAQRLYAMAKNACTFFKSIKSVEIIDWKSMDDIEQPYDWLVACYTETSIGLKLDVKKLKQISEKCGAQLMLDATASMGLEDKHDLADVISYSSCKGLFGLTGAAFVAFNELPQVEVPSFNLSLLSHLEKKMTGPYHAICSLDKVMMKHEQIRQAVFTCKKVFAKRFTDQLVFPRGLQPQLCTQVVGRIESLDNRAILYTPRALEDGRSVVCHLGEVHLADASLGEINECLTLN